MAVIFIFNIFMYTNAHRDFDCRTLFVENDDGIVEGRIADAASLPHPLRIHPTPLHPDDVQTLLEKEAHQVLDLSNGRLLSAVLFNVEDGRHILAVTLHHAAAGEY